MIEILAILSVIAFLQIGIYIGREFGNFTNFILWYINYWFLGKRILPPYSDEEIPDDRMDILK